MGFKTKLESIDSNIYPQPKFNYKQKIIWLTSAPLTASFKAAYYKYAQFIKLLCAKQMCPKLQKVLYIRVENLGGNISIGDQRLGANYFPRQDYMIV